MWFGRRKRRPASEVLQDATAESDAARRLIEECQLTLKGIRLHLRAPPPLRSDRFASLRRSGIGKSPR